jgi:DNA helicase-2/ATP-dependent DNA helicase PcrA
MANPSEPATTRDLNDQQLAAAQHGAGPLLIIAGAGTGKTRTLVHRVAHLIERGVAPDRILLLTFTRRASAEMLRRVDGVLRNFDGKPAGTTRKLWGGTFHAIATGLLRHYGKAIGLQPGFTILDRSDSEDLLDVARTDLKLTKTERRFPKKGTCLAIYSACVNSQRPLTEVIADQFPWCEDATDDLKRLFSAYVDRKSEAAVLDYDDLLLFWQGLLHDDKAAPRVRDRFDHVLVDEYQDTNYLQADILTRLRPDGAGLTVVGDDAQSIYSFRAATVRNILDFPQHFPGTTVVKLEENYRSTPPILAVTNEVIAEASEGFSKELWSSRTAGNKPQLVTCEDEDEQAEFVIERILEHREAGLELKQQAVLFRAAHHSTLFEAELARRNIPFVKYGGLKFIETGHVKDLMAFLRLAENSHDLVAGMRALTLLPGIGPKRSRQLMNALLETPTGFEPWADAAVPSAAALQWTSLLKVFAHVRRDPEPDLSSQIQQVRSFYEPLLEDKYENPEPRVRDLEQLQRLAPRFANRRTLLAEFALDPPVSAEDFAGPPELDEDYLILSTIHSAKGLEWKSVYVIHAADGNIPSDMATGSTEQIEEERRLFYVALTRARDWLYVCCPLRYYHLPRGPRADKHGYAQLTRFVTKKVAQHFDCRTASTSADNQRHDDGHTKIKDSHIRDRVKSLWS